MFDLEIGYLDIEVHAGDQMPDAGHDPITCICFSDGEEYVSWILDDIDIDTKDGDWAIIHLDSEEKLLRRFTDFLYEANPDILTGWNIFWDKEYLEKRCYKYRLQLPLSGTCMFDLLSGYRTLFRRKSYRLKDIALHEGLAEELEEKVNYGEMWEKDKPGLLERNKRHVKWVVEVDRKTKVISYYWELKEYAGLENLEDALHNSVLIDTMLLRRTELVLPSKEKREHEVYEGAFVMQPQAGVFKDIAIFDLSKFYPAVILSEKLDPIILYEFRKDNNRGLDWEKYKEFAKDYISKGKPTLVFELVSDLIEKRRQLQTSGHEEKKAAIKGICNSTYGVFAAPSFRIYTREIPERITEVARDTIKALAEDVTQWGYTVHYMDTDSLFCHVAKEELPKVETKLNAALSKYGDYEIKLEAFCPSLLFTGAKKRYSYLDENGEVHTTGFEKVRSDSSEFTKEVQEEVMRMMLTDRMEAIIPFLQDKVRGIKNCSLRDIAITKTLSKGLGEYDKHEQNYILAAREAKLDVKAGDALNIIPARNYPFGVAVFVDTADLPRKIEVDYNAIVDKQVRMKVRDLLPICQLSWEEVGGQRRML